MHRGFHRDQNRLNKSPLSRSSSRSKSLSAFACMEYKPCFQFARRDRAKPSGVRGPVLAPPCIRQRPLRIAGAGLTVTEPWLAHGDITRLWILQFLKGGARHGILFRIRLRVALPYRAATGSCRFPSSCSQPQLLRQQMPGLGARPPLCVENPWVGDQEA